MTQNIPNIDASISSRAPAKTALSNEVWTDELAKNIQSQFNNDTISIPFKFEDDGKEREKLTSILKVEGKGRLTNLLLGGYSSKFYNIIVKIDGKDLINLSFENIKDSLQVLTSIITKNEIQDKHESFFGSSIPYFVETNFIPFRCNESYSGNFKEQISEKEYTYPGRDSYMWAFITQNGIPFSKNLEILIRRSGITRPNLRDTKTPYVEYILEVKQ